MIFKRVISIAIGEGEQLDGITQPFDIDRESVYEIAGMVNKHGAILKKYSTVTDTSGTSHTVRGNYKALIKRVRVEQGSNFKGFKK